MKNHKLTRYTNFTTICEILIIKIKLNQFKENENQIKSN